MKRCIHCEAELPERSPTACYDCRYRESVTRQGLRWAGLALLPDAKPWKAYTDVARLGDLRVSHSHRGYWIVKGSVPQLIALELYADPAGRDLIRVCGHCQCPPPTDPWLVYRTPDGREVITRKDYDEAWAFSMRHAGSTIGVHVTENLKRIVADDDRANKYPAFVEMYHIDGDLGLRIFVDTLRRHGVGAEREAVVA